MSSFRTHAGLIILCALFFVSGLLRLNDLSLYTPDSSRYVIWGTALAEGKGYVDATQPEPDRYVVHAPLYPLILAPVEFFYPLSVEAAKTWTLLLGVLALILLYRLTSSLISKTAALVAVLLLGFNPLFLLYGSEALSEVPFVAAVLAACLLLEQTVKERPSRTAAAGLAILLPATALLREPGIALVLAAVFFLVLNRKFALAGAIVAMTALMIGGWYWRNQVHVGMSAGSAGSNLSISGRHFVTPPDASFASEMASRMWLQLKAYSSALSGMIFFPYFNRETPGLIVGSSVLFDIFRALFVGVRYLVMILVPMLAAAGIFDDFKWSSTSKFRLMFTAGYIAVILLYPVHDVRFFFPLLPLVIYYMLRGARHIANWISVLPRLRRPSLLIACALIVMIPNLESDRLLIQSNSEYREGPIPMYRKLSVLKEHPAIYTYPWSIIGRWVADSLPQHEVIASPAKELAVVIGDRKMLELDPGVSTPAFEEALRNEHVGYLLAPVRWGNLRSYEFQMRESRRLQFDVVCNIAGLRLMRVHSRYAAPSAGDTSLTGLADSVTPAGLLRIGRNLIQEQSYTLAIQVLEHAAEMFPRRPEITLNLLTAYALSGDSANAAARFAELLALPQAGSSLFAANAQMQLLRDVSAARRMEEGPTRELTFSRAAGGYWSLGYPRAASTLASELTRCKSRYFLGLLWGYHYAYLLGDSILQNEYLRQLQGLDPSNPVLIAFGRLRSLDDSLRCTSSARERSRLHLRKAWLFKEIELNEDALDEAERSIHDDPSNGSAFMFQGELYERRNQLRSALSMYKSAASAGGENSVPKEKIAELERKLASM
ncbi:MAG TPA: glycosyltransferase family 39 protein [Bacteroidota bacterium]|nr:glycosyltransferase family 39 protein [Bacteroidota bacterium]